MTRDTLRSREEDTVSSGASYPANGGSGEVDANRMQSRRKQGLRMRVAKGMVGTYGEGCCFLESGG